MDLVDDSEVLCDQALELFNASDTPGAVRLWQQAADLGSSRGLYNLGVVAEGRGDTDEAKRLYGLACACEPPFPLAFHNLAGMAIADDELDLAAELAETAAELGVAQGAFNRAQIALWADDMDTARHWWRRAVDLGDETAAYNLGMSAKIDGDETAAQEWFRIAAERGSADGMNDYAVGLRIAGDHDEAHVWFERAAASGSTNAMRNLGDITLLDGDVDQARNWYEQAAAGGDEAASEQLALLQDPILRRASSTNSPPSTSPKKFSMPSHDSPLQSGDGVSGGGLPPSNSIFCTSCGHRLGEQDRFCIECGTQQSTS